MNALRQVRTGFFEYLIITIILRSFPVNISIAKFWLHTEIYNYCFQPLTFHHFCITSIWFLKVNVLFPPGKCGSFIPSNIYFHFHTNSTFNPPLQFLKRRLSSEARAWAEPHSLVNLPIPENLVITWPYTDRPPSVRTTGKPMFTLTLLASLGAQEKTNCTSMLWSIDSCQNRVSADQYHLAVSRAQVSTHRDRVLFWSYPLTSYWFSNDRRLKFMF